MGRLAGSEDAVLFARFDEAEKCEFIEANIPVEAWSPTDDGEGLLIKASALREQARTILVSAVRYRTPPLVASHEPLSMPTHRSKACGLRRWRSLRWRSRKRRSRRAATAARRRRHSRGTT